MNRGSMAMIQKQSPNGSCLVLYAQEGMAKSHQDQDHVNCVFWLGRCWPSWVHPTRPNNEYYLNVLHWLRDAMQWKQLWLWATGDWQLHHDNLPSHASHLLEFFGKTSNHPGDSVPLDPRFFAFQLLAFPQTKIAFERKEISDHQRDQENRMGQLMVIPTKDFAVFLNTGRDAGRTAWGPKVPTLKETGVSLFYVQCFLCLVSSSILVSICHSMWLDTFWADLICSGHGGMEGDWTLETWGRLLFSPE